MNSDWLPISYAFAFFFSFHFTHRNFCAFAMFRRAAADMVYFFGCPFGVGSAPVSSLITSIRQPELFEAKSFARSGCVAYNVQGIVQHHVKVHSC
jgi:hypothetical protein